MTIVDESAATQTGVRIGDSLEVAQENYDDLECGEVDEGIEYVGYPACTKVIRTGRAIWFGGDPIDTIELFRRRAAGSLD